MTQRTHSAVEPIGIGDAIGHYRILGVVGGGSLGPLYVAEQRGIRGVSKIVSLRFVRPEIAKSARFRELFLDAARIAPRFEHPNVVTIHEMGELEGNYFVSMEYLPAENLAAVLTRCNTDLHVPPDIAASLVKQTASAVQYLHDFRRAEARPDGLGSDEVDASNVFVTYHGTVKLLDVGLRSFRNGGETSIGAEGFNHQIARVADRHEDVLDLGAVLWTCLTGRTPNLARDNLEDDTSEHALAPSSVRADVPKALDAIALRALSREPFERFQSARELSEALEQYLLRRDTWPTPRLVRRWLEQLFDVERASLHLQVAEGRDVESALALLGTRQRPGGDSAPLARTLVRPRQLWSTSHSVFSRLSRGSLAPPRSFQTGSGSLSHDRLPVSSIVTRQLPSPLPSPLVVPAELPAVNPAQIHAVHTLRGSAHEQEQAPAAKPRSWLMVALLVLGVIVAVAVVVIVFAPSERPPLSASPQSQLLDRSGRVDVRSTPEGAAVFVDGEPTGLMTPAVLKGLAEGRPVRVRVEKAGYASQEREIKVAEGPLEPLRFELKASAGLVHFAALPSDARIFIDDVEVTVERGKPVSLSVGTHGVRVETPSALMFSGTVVVAPGEQTLRVDGAGAAP